MADDIVHIARDGKELGEYAVKDVQDYLAKGNLVETDFYWRPGMTAWRPLADLKTQRENWKLPFTRPTEQEPNFIDGILFRENKNTMLAMLWDKLARAECECLLTRADYDEINQATRSNILNRCKQELENWYITAVRAYLQDHVFSPVEKINLKNLMNSLGINPMRATEIQTDEFRNYYELAFQMIVGRNNDFSDKLKQITLIENDIPLPQTVIAGFRTEMFGKLLSQILDKRCETVGDVQIISVEEAKKFEEIVTGLKLHMVDYPEVAETYSNAKIFYQVMKGELKEVSCDLDLGREKCYWTQPVDLYQTKRVVTRRNYGGFSSSIKIFGSLRYRVGSYNVDRETEDQVVKIDTGMAIFTSQRVIFNGPYKNLNFKYGKIIEIKHYSNGMVIGKDSGGDIFFKFDGGTRQSAALLKRLVNEAKQ